MHIVIHRTTPPTDFLLGLTLDTLRDVPHMTGTLDGSGFSSQITLSPTLYNATTNLLPGGLVSKYTALFMPEMSAVANGVTITHASNLVGVASWPLFVPLHANQGYIAGQVSFNSTPGVSDFEGGTVPNAAFSATGGNLAAPIARNVTLNTAIVFITPVDGVALKLTLTATTGLFTGTFKDGTATRTIGGVIYQEGNFGSGFFPGTTVSGEVEVESNP